MVTGHYHRLGELFNIQQQIVSWHKQECQKIKLQARSEELNKSESVRIYHHELHKRKIKRTSITKLDTDSQILIGHKEFTNYLEKTISDLLLHPANLYEAAQDELLKEVGVVFADVDNRLLMKSPDKEEVKKSVETANLHAAPGTDGLTTYLYHTCWEILGDGLTEVVKTVHNGHPPT